MHCQILQSRDVGVEFDENNCLFEDGIRGNSEIKRDMIVSFADQDDDKRAPLFLMRESGLTKFSPVMNKNSETVSIHCLMSFETLGAQRQILKKAADGGLRFPPDIEEKKNEPLPGNVCCSNLDWFLEELIFDRKVRTSSYGAIIPDIKDFCETYVLQTPAICDALGLPVEFADCVFKHIIGEWKDKCCSGENEEWKEIISKNEELKKLDAEIKKAETRYKKAQSGYHDSKHKYNQELHKVEECFKDALTLRIENILTAARAANQA